MKIKNNYIVQDISAHDQVAIGHFLFSLKVLFGGDFSYGSIWIRVFLVGPNLNVQRFIQQKVQKLDEKNLNKKVSCNFKKKE
jgi:hypothetical protein